jgi:hypothetical protein
MNDLAKIRETFAQVLDEISSAELVYSETMDVTAESGREKRHRVLTEDDELENFIITIRHRSETIYSQVTRRLNELKLKIGPPAYFNVPENLTLEDITQQMRQLLEMCQSVYQEIQDNATLLQNERKKWWKFW